jgi:chromate transport protein ChrA
MLYFILALEIVIVCLSFYYARYNYWEPVKDFFKCFGVLNVIVILLVLACWLWSKGLEMIKEGRWF